MASIFKGGLFKFISKLFGGGGGGNWLFAVLMLISLFTKKKKKYAAESKPQQESPTYSWENVTTTADVDIPIPLIFGRHQVGGNIVNTYITTKLIKSYTTSAITVSWTGSDPTTKSSIFITPSGLSASQLDFYIGNSWDKVGEKLTDLVNGTKGDTPRLSVLYKKSTDADWTIIELKTSQFMQFLTTYNGKQAIHIVLKDLDTTFSGYYQVKLVYTPKTTIKKDFLNRTYVETESTSAFNGFSVIGATKSSVVNVGTSDMSAQTLYLDVALGIGQLNKVNNIQINDQYVADYTNPTNITTKSVRVTHEFKPGHDLLVPLNKNDYITVQSAVYNKNTEIVRQVKTTLSQPPTQVGGKWVLYVDNINVFLNPDGSLPTEPPENFRRKIYLLNSYGEAQWFHISGISGTLPNMGLEVDTAPAQPHPFLAGDGAYAWYDGHTETGDFIDFEYTTQNDYCDKLDIGLNAPEGIYTINTETGDLIAMSVLYEIWIAHKSAANRKTDAFKHEVVTVTGSKRSRIWLNYIADNLPYDSNRKKEYNITVRKLTALDSDINNNYKTKLVCSYVEEIKNKDIYYNNVGYCSLIMPADSKLNSGTPSFKFEVDGLSLPTPLPDSLEINGDTSTTSTIYLKNKGNVVNYVDGGVDYHMNTPAVDDFDFDNWSSILLQSLVTINPTYNITGTTRIFKDTTYKGSGEEILTGYFKCADGKWYKRYCVFTNTGAAGKENQIARFSIITSANIDALIAEYNAPAVTDLLTKVKDIYTDSALPSVPVDMVIYKWSANASDAILYMLTNEDNGLAIPFQNINIASFMEARDYFNEEIQDPLNPNRKIRRCELNLVIDTINNAREHINKICATCHSALYETNGVISIVVDRAKDVVVALTEDDHLLPDSLKVTSLPSKEIPNQINITYLNAANNYKKEPVTIEDPALSRSVGYDKLRKMDIDLYGITDESHVYIEGLRLIKAARAINFSIQFKTALAGLRLEVGDVFTLTSGTNGWVDKKFRVLSVKRMENLEVELSAVEYDPSVYDILPDDLVHYNTVKHTSLPNLSQKPNAIQNLSLRENAFSNASGDITLDIIGTFNPPDAPALLPRNGIAYLSADAAFESPDFYLENSSDIDKLKVGDKIAFNTQLIVLADEFIDAVTPYTITALNRTTKKVTVSPVLAAPMYKRSFISKYEYVMNQYEYSKYSHVLADLYKDGILIEENHRFEGTSLKFGNVSTGLYTVVVKAVSAAGVMGEATYEAITITGKTLAPPPVTVASASIYKFNHVYRIIWDEVTAKDVRFYRIIITNTQTQTVVATKDVIFPLEHIHTFAESGNYDIDIYTVNTSGILSASSYKINKDIVVGIVDAFTAHYTIQGGMIQLSWPSVDVANELTRYEAYMNNTPFTLTDPDAVFDPVTNPYIGLTPALKAWEGTSIQIPIGNLPENGAPLSFDEHYYIIVVAKFKYNGVEKTKQSLMITIEPLSSTSPKIAWYSFIPEIIDGVIGQNSIKPFVIAVPDSSVTTVTGSIGRYENGVMSDLPLTFTKVNGLWECEITDLEDGDYVLSAIGQNITGGRSNIINQTFTIDTSIPAALPRPYITKDNTYIQTQLISYTAQTTTPITSGESIDIYNSKTIQICLPPFTTCKNFFRLKMYIAEYNSSTKLWGSYVEYKLPQGILKSEEDVVNFKASVTFTEDMPDFRIKVVQVKTNGLEGRLADTLPSVRSKIDTTPPLIKINSITYDGDTTGTNYVNNNYINAKVNLGLGLLFDLTTTETNSGLWSNAVDEANLKMPFYYQINNGTKKALRNASGLFCNAFLIPKADFAGITEGAKVTITLFALDNAMKVGSVTMTKLVDLTPPDNVTGEKAVFGVESNTGVIKLSWTNPANTDLAGLRVYEGATLVKEITGVSSSTSIKTENGTLRNFTLKAVDLAGNESFGTALSAVNYAPKKVGTLTVNSSSGAINVMWPGVTEDINNDAMTDLKYYEISYYNPALDATITARVPSLSHLITMTAAEQTYFNANQDMYVNNIKVRAVDFFGAEGAYSDTAQGRPRFIESADMTGNMFKFVPAINGSYSLVGASSTECIVDANYKNTEYVNFTNVYQGVGVRLDMRPEYIAETKLKFVGGVSSFARFIIHYRVVHPTKFIESDVYLASSSGHSINSIYEETTLSTAYTNYIQVPITDVMAGTDKDKENVFVVSLMKSALTRKSFFVKYVELLFADDSYTVQPLAELQPRVRSIANEFYGETMYLSKMLAIRSSEDANNYINLTSTYLEMFAGGAQSLVLGDLGIVSGSGYGLWAKNNIKLGGTTAANANLSIDTSSVNIGYVGAYTYAYNTRITNNVINIGLRDTTYGYYDTQITAGNISLCYVPNWYSHQVLINSSYILMRDYTDSTKQVMISGQSNLNGIGIQYIGYWNSKYYYETVIRGGEIYLGFKDAYAEYHQSYNVKINSTGIYLGHSGLVLSDIAQYRVRILAAGEIGIGIASAGATTIYNTVLTGSDVKIGCSDIYNSYYNTFIESGRIRLGHLASGTNYAVDMNYSGAESATMRYFSIKGSDLNEYFRVGFFQNGTYYKRATWMKRTYISSDYTADVGGSLGATSYAFMKMTENVPGLYILAGLDVTSYPAIGILAQTATALDITRVASGNACISIDFAGTGNGITVVGYSTSTANGVKSTIDGTASALYGLNTNSGLGIGVYGISYGTDFTSCHGVVGYTPYGGCAGYFVSSARALHTYGSVKMENLSTASTGTVLVIDGNNIVRPQSSSLRYKDMIAPVADFSMKKFNSLVPYRFRYKESGLEDIGFAAETILGIFPELVNFNNAGQPESLKYDRFSLYNILATQEHDKQINTLTQEIALLMQQVSDLKKIVDNLIKE